MRQELSFGEWLRRRRQALGLTQEALARQVGCSTIALRKIEAEERRPSRQIAERLAHFLRVDARHSEAFVRFARGEINAGLAMPDPLEAGRGSPTAPRSGIPSYLSSFVGREAEAAGVIELIQRDSVRLVTLIGPPGIGKTRLAVRVADDLAKGGRFEGGIAFISLAEIDDPSQLLPMIAQSIGLEDPQGADMATRLASVIGAAERLLVLDNFEHLAEASPVLAELLRAAPPLRALVTSRAALRVEGEVLFQVPPLGVPDLEGLPATEVVRRFSAIRLFEERARLTRADFSVTADSASAVTAICARLDGLPLGIELAAARVDLLPLPELLARLGGKFVLHLEGLRGRPVRHRSMNDAVGWSYELLDPQEQRAFRFMSVCLGGFTLEAAQAVCAQPAAAPGAAEPDGLEILRLTTALVEKGLLVPTEDPVGEARFGMLAVIREYALERQEEAGESDSAGRKHAAFFRAFAEMAEPNLLGPDQVSWLDRLGADQHNLRAALKWSLSKDAETGLAIAGGLWRYWLVRSQVSEGREWLERLMAAAAASADTDAPPRKPRVKAGTTAAHLAMVQGDSARARSLAEDSLAMAEEIGDRELHAFALAIAGEVAYKLNDLDRGERLLGESLEIFRKLGHAWGITFSLGNLFSLAVIQDDWKRIDTLLAERLLLTRELGDKWGIAESLSQLGGVARIQCDFGAARAFHEEQLALARELGSRAGIALALNSLAWAAREDGDFEVAIGLYEESLALSREAGNKWRVAGVLNGLGVIAWRQGDLRRARGTLEESLALRLEIGNAQWIAYARQNLGDVYRSEGDREEARGEYRQALRLLSPSQRPKTDISEALRRIGAAAADRGRFELAARILGAAGAVRLSAGPILPPLDRGDHERDVAVVRSMLGEEAFESAWTQGLAMSMAEAIDCGLNA